MKKMMIVMMLALFSIAGMSQEPVVFESNEQVWIKDGESTETSVDISITVYRGTAIIASEEESMAMLFTGEVEKQTQDDIEVIFMEVVDGQCLHAVLGMAEFSDGSYMFRLITDEFEVYYKGHFQEEIAPKKSNPSFKTVS